MKINYDKFMLVPDNDDRLDLALEELQKFSASDPPDLSDIYTNLNRGGQAILMALDHSEKQNNRVGGNPFMWKIQVLRDEWGNVPQPGEIIARVEPINRKNRKYHPVAARVLNAAKVDGSFSEKFEHRRQYVVDPKGCIECTFHDAGYFLFNWGVHFRTGYGLCGKDEHSREPVKAPNGQTMHIWYWRYAEVPVKEYEKLDPRVAPKTKRGKSTQNPEG